MSSWLERQASNHYIQLGAVAVLSGATVASVIFTTQYVRRKEKLEELKASIPDLSEDHKADLLNEFGTPQRSSHRSVSKEDQRSEELAQRALAGDYDSELIDEQLTRTRSFLGPERFAKLRCAFVVIVGLGGVGSHCVSALARSGVSKIRLVDFDQVTLSSLNRHAVATLLDVGTPKVDCVRRRSQGIVPWVGWECFNEMWRAERAPVLLGSWDGGNGQRPDYIVDAIDNIDSKVALLKWCHEHNLRVISSMGAGCKSDPTRIFIGNISSTIEDPLSKATRRRLKMAGIAEGIPVVYSTEKPGPGKAELLPLPEEEFEKGKVNELSVLPDFRARILPVLGTMPAIFGLILANTVIMEITGYPHEQSVGKARDKLYDAALSYLQGLEERLLRHHGKDPLGLKLPVSKEDIGYLIEEVYRGKSVVSGLPTRLTLVRWEPPESEHHLTDNVAGQKTVRLNFQDLVCMTREEASKHVKEVLEPRLRPDQVYGPEVLNLVAQRRAEEQYYCRWR